MIVLGLVLLVELPRIYKFAIHFSWCAICNILHVVSNCDVEVTLVLIGHRVGRILVRQILKTDIKILRLGLML